jgi:carboxymethylenebutenolidase
MDGRPASGIALERSVLTDTAGDDFAIHVRWSAAPAAAAAVVLLPAIAGLNQYVADRAGDLSGCGYTVVVVDYFSRGEPAPDLSSPDRIDAAVAALDDRRVLGDIASSLHWLAGQGIPRERVGVLGLCVGGSYALLAAGQTEGPACAVAYYGQLRYPQRTARRPVDPMEAAADLRVPVLGHFGEMDRLISAQEVGDFGARLRAAQRHHELWTYAGAPHAFDEWFRPAVFRPAASAEAWRRTLVFLDWHLRQRRPV